MGEHRGGGGGIPNGRNWRGRRAVRGLLGAGCPAQEPRRLTRVESINITTIDTININTGKHFKSVQRFFLGPFFIVGPGIRFEGRGTQVSGGEFL